MIVHFKVIMDPNLDWDKTFLSPSCSKISKSTLEDKATFWKAPCLTRQSNAKTAAAIANQCASGETSSSDVFEPSVKIREARNKKSNTFSLAGSKTITCLFNQNACIDNVATRNKIISQADAGIAAAINMGHSEGEEKENTSN